MLNFNCVIKNFKLFSVNYYLIGAFKALKINFNSFIELLDSPIIDYRSVILNHIKSFMQTFTSFRVYPKRLLRGYYSCKFYQSKATNNFL